MSGHVPISTHPPVIDGFGHFPYSQIIPSIPSALWSQKALRLPTNRIPGVTSYDVPVAVPKTCTVPSHCPCRYAALSNHPPHRPIAPPSGVVAPTLGNTSAPLCYSALPAIPLLPTRSSFLPSPPCLPAVDGLSLLGLQRPSFTTKWTSNIVLPTVMGSVLDFSTSLVDIFGADSDSHLFLQGG